MFGLFKKAKPDFFDIREALFADASLSDWRVGAAVADSIAPASHVEAARHALDRGDAASAVSSLRALVELPGVETRQLLQAWHCLRLVGFKPDPKQAKRVLGVVLEVHLSSGLDTLAGYADGSARYINHGGRLVVWDAEDDEISDLISNLLCAGQRVVEVIGPWEEPRRPPPPKNHVRLNMLTPSGLHFGEGPFAALSADSIGGPAIAAGTKLMQALIRRAERTTA